MAIPVKVCTCERTFSKLSIVKTKLRSTMKQERLDGLLTMFIEQELAYNINVDKLKYEIFLLFLPSIFKYLNHYWLWPTLPQMSAHAYGSYYNTRCRSISYTPGSSQQIRETV